MNKDKIIVAEYFYSIQGEGPTMGRPAIFLRLGGCNLFCNGAWRCDTIEVWQKGKAINFEAIGDGLMKKFDLRKCHLIITGGEPLMQDKQIVKLLDYIFQCKQEPKCIEVETNGTIEPSEELDLYVDQYNVSLKLSGSGEKEERRIKPKVIDWFSYNKNSIFKFVIANKEDIFEMQQMVSKYQIDISDVWLMPACDTREKLITESSWLVEYCKRERYNFSPRLQLLIWDKTVGV